MKIQIQSKHECEYNGSIRKNLKGLILKKHKGILFQYSECEYNANIKGVWTFHINSRHRGLTFSCYLCYHSDFSSSQLKNHHMTFQQSLRLTCDKKGLRQCAKLQDLGECDCCDCYGGKQSQILFRRLRTILYFVGFAQNPTS